MVIRMKNVSLICVLLLSVITVSAQESLRSSPPKSKDTPKPVSKSISLPPEKAAPVRLARFDTPPVIDGRVEDEVWKSAAVLKDFYQVQPGDNIAPSKATEVMLGYDSKYLYIAFRAYDEPGKVRATVPKRDDIWADDNVGMFIDTLNDKRKAYALFFSPLGVQADGILTEGRGEDYSLDIVMESKGLVTEDGYTVEIAIPFKSLRYEAGEGKLWGAHFFRRIKRFDNELDSWMPLARDKSGTLNQTGHLTGLESISTERTLDIIPTLTLSETGRRVRTLSPMMISSTPGLTDPGRFVNQPAEFDPGITARLGITPTVTLDFTANPDFAQVEADQPVITANQRFPIFFAEKRPFFLEGRDVFQTPMTVVHTRAIVDPDYAVKLSGKQGRNTFGLLLASDNAPGNFSREERADPDLLPAIERFLDKNAYIGVLRLKRDLGRENSLGLIATSYNFIERHNHVTGFDGRFRLDEKTVFSFQAIGTASRRFFFDPDLGQSLFRTGNGFAYWASYDVSGRNFGYELYGEGRTGDYRADVGFTSRTDTNFNSFFVRYNSDPKPKARLISWRVYNFSHIDYDFQGRLQTWETESQLSLSLARQTYLGMGYERGHERLFEDEFGARRTETRTGAFFGPEAERSSTKHHFFIFGGSQPNKTYSINIEGAYRRGHFDFDFGAGPRFPRVSPAATGDPGAPLDPGPGNLLDVGINFTYQPTNALRASLNYIRNRLVRHDTDRVAFDDQIYSLRATYQFTRFVFTRARLDYTTLGARVRGQYLFGWTPSPDTSFYAGYNDDLNYNGFNSFSSNREPGFRLNSRTFFIKMSYLFRRSF